MMENAIATIFVFGFLLFLAIVALADGPTERREKEPEHLLVWHSAYGQWRVLYPDGEISQPFSLSVAEDYQELFGGQIVPRDYR
jgi:hypothetical protein